jgi:hypothetical protein
MRKVELTVRIGLKCSLKSNIQRPYEVRPPHLKIMAERIKNNSVELSNNNGVLPI